MPKYLVEASYTAEGLKGLIKDKASGRKAVVAQALADLGGQLDSIYFTMGERDVLLVCECPDYASVAALGMAASASGVVRTKITPLLTVEELDETIAKGVNYRARCLTARSALLSPSMRSARRRFIPAHRSAIMEAMKTDLSDEQVKLIVEAMEHYYSYTRAAQREDSRYQKLANRLKKKR